MQITPRQQRQDAAAIVKASLLLAARDGGRPGPQHILLAVAAVPGPTAALLAEHGLSADALVGAVRQQLGGALAPGDPVGGRRRRRAKATPAHQEVMRRAIRLGDDGSPTPRTLLLAVLDSGDEVVEAALRALGRDVASLRRAAEASRP